ncbi:MAG: 50S ribosomal protein L32 [Microcystis sp.]|jgi:large subunit ribosomal protein L32|uniref:Large ribosomal subunit protein bL32 n=1 Tax=Microcystis flos-aquae Mf_QC_C_20070823_S10D TaxID=2486236 RepID=A0A552KYI7_9CHRO|nr:MULTISPECIES: 50S ribosomal protein L32 [unclassified Microcystis]MCA2815955.1 50S ribosomal protein L32 [Microcystis sp. M085S1]MCA2855012.1 50S ribosomal protein L32 [Microcystis sp. M065S1]MCZ8055651.1 50S ribosomal protein L32 [Microcystis sp. LE19-12.2C]MDJ0549152.1 50S ribosomal protein L32 [Microcystis sp. M49637_WE12]TRT80857.1 MAG: 50S ribosomal protein L32 [Microcystis flos-aquae Ma_QC_C_20070823_S18]TRT91055.1 MAG: 50S ribosomal protein L32 [Microcystis flos-aquae Ma_QC_C_200708
MACPKKKTSNAKRDQRRAHWRKQAAREAQKALSLGKSVLSGRSNSFVYPTKEEEEGGDKE